MGKRITIRIDDQRYDRLQERSQETGLDSSFLVREAIQKYLADSGTNNQETKSAGISQVMPAEAFAQTGPYRAWSGDLRAELKRQLLEMLALAHATAEQYPKTKGVREVYLAVLNAYYQLNGVGHGQ